MNPCVFCGEEIDPGKIRAVIRYSCGEPECWPPPEDALQSIRRLRIKIMDLESLVGAYRARVQLLEKALEGKT